MKDAAKQFLGLLGAIAFALHGVAAWVRGPRRQPEQSEVRGILVVRLDLMGDVVFSIPAIEALAERFPEARIDALVLPYAADLLSGHPALRSIYQLDVNRYRRPAGWRRVGSLLATIRHLRAQRYDVAVGLSGLMGGVFAAVSGARWTVGYAAETYHGCYNLPVPGRRYELPQHEVAYCLDLVRSIAPTAAADAAPRVPRLQTARVASRDLIAVSPYAVLVPGASNGSAKRWPAPLWARLADRVSRDLGLRVVLSGAASEQGLVQQVMDAMETTATNVAGATSVVELVDLLRGAQVVVAGDTGPLHVAAALDRPVVGIFGPTDPTNTGPLATSAVVVRMGLACSPCYDLRTPADCKLPDKSIACMWRITPDTVLEAVKEALAGSAAPATKDSE